MNDIEQLEREIELAEQDVEAAGEEFAHARDSLREAESYLSDLRRQKRDIIEADRRKLGEWNAMSTGVRS